jgi:hypothetical protein
VARDAEPPGPRPLADSLRTLASRVVRVDLVGFAGVEAAWPSMQSVRAIEAVPVRVSDGELCVAVPTGAHAARARRDAAAILDELATLVTTPPTRLRVVVQAR